MIRFALSAWLWIVLVTLIGGCSDGSDGPDILVESTDIEELDPCDLPVDDIPISSTESGVEYVRTPDACFENLEIRTLAVGHLAGSILVVEDPEAGFADNILTGIFLHGKQSIVHHADMAPVLDDHDRVVYAVNEVLIMLIALHVDPFQSGVTWLPNLQEV